MCVQPQIVLDCLLDLKEGESRLSAFMSLSMVFVRLYYGWLIRLFASLDQYLSLQKW